MAFSVGQIVSPRRRYLGRLSTYTTTAAGVRVYDTDVLVDSRNWRSSFGQVTEVLGAVALTTVFFNRADAAVSRRIYWNAAEWAPSTAYTVGAYVSANGSLWRCTVGGTSDVGSGPTGTSPVVDGGATWTEVYAPERSDGAISAAQTGTIYAVTVWDIDARMWVNDFYPEDELSALVSYAELMALEVPVPDPTNVLPYVSAGHVDLAAPPADVSDLARAYELSGVDPRT